MTAAAIADTLNRHVAQLVCAQLDAMDVLRPLAGPWHWMPIADTLADDADATRNNRVWTIAWLAAKTPGCQYDGAPADFDWDNLFSHFRAEVLARRSDPQALSVREAENPVRDGVGSQ